jgi:hypothetical protein
VHADQGVSRPRRVERIGSPRIDGQPLAAIRSSVSTAAFTVPRAIVSAAPRARSGPSELAASRAIAVAERVAATVSAIVSASPRVDRTIIPDDPAIGRTVPRTDVQTTDDGVPATGSSKASG